jgi:ABC-type Na+ efflux pump permease subunit
MRVSIKSDLRIIWSIAFKDILEAIKNKNILAVIFPALFMIVLYRFMPAITADEGPPVLYVYDFGNPVVLSILEESPTYQLFIFESEDKMLYQLSNGEQPELGLVIPEGFDQAIQTEKSLRLQGYMLHFFPIDQVLELRNYFEDEISYLLGLPVSIQIDHQVQLQPETHGITILASMGLSFVLLMVGMIVIPHLMLEEKLNKTLDALLVSPAGGTHIVLSKALTGLIITLLVYGIGLFLFSSVIIHWWLVFMVGFLGALFSVAIGLLLGILVDTRQQLILWAWVGLVPLFLPMMLSFMDDLLPYRIIQILKWVPSSAMMRVLRSSMVGMPSVENYFPQLVILVFSSLFVLTFDFRLIRRLDQ